MLAGDLLLIRFIPSMSSFLHDALVEFIRNSYNRPEREAPCLCFNKELKQNTKNGNVVQGKLPCLDMGDIFISNQPRPQRLGKNILTFPLTA